MHIKCVDKYNYDDLYSRLFAQYPNLVEIKAPYITDRSLDALKAASGSELRVAELETMNCDAVARVSLIYFVSQCPKLVSLVLDGDLNCVTDATVQAIATHCPRMEKLSLTDRVGLTDLSVAYLSSLSHLRELDILFCPGLTIIGLQTLFQSIPNIESLSIEINQAAVVHADPLPVFQSLGRFCPRLRVFMCYSEDFGIYDDGYILPLIAGCPLLEVVEVIDHSINDEVLFALGKSCPRLRSIEFGQPSYTDQGLIALSRGCPKLTQLQLYSAPNISDMAILSFAEHCSKLESMTVFDNNLITYQAFLALLKANPGIKSIWLGNGRVLKRETLLSIADNCNKLVFLNRFGLQHWAEAMLSTLLTRFTWLEFLYLSKSDVIARTCVVLALLWFLYLI